jgi:DNA-directed RNA polymerase specialized sigma24 family protein
MHFLLALETLAPRARAVLLLREVLDYASGRSGERARHLREQLRVLHHRARRRLDAARPAPRPLREVAASTPPRAEAPRRRLMRQDGGC